MKNKIRSSVESIFKDKISKLRENSRRSQLRKKNCAALVYNTLNMQTDCFQTEYATVGYMAKRLQMRKSRIMAMQKLAEQKKSTLEGHSHPRGSHAHSHSHSTLPGPPMDPDHIPKQTVSNVKFLDFFILEHVYPLGKVYIATFYASNIIKMIEKI